MLTHLTRFDGKREMTQEKNRVFEEYPEIKQYLSEIPEDLWSIFLPITVEELHQLSDDIKALRIREKEREYIIELREKYGLPFRPNATIDETIKRIRLIKWQQKMKNHDSQDIENGAENSSIDPDEELI